MAFRYEVIAAAKRDLEQLTRHNPRLAQLLLTDVIPALLRDPNVAGESKVGDLAGFRAFPFRLRNVTYRLVYTVHADVVEIWAVGPHDVAYERARRR